MANPSESVQCKPLQVVVDGKGVERAIKHLKRKLAAEGLLRELKKRRHYMKPSIKKRKKIAEAADPLYKTLDDGQKRRLALLTHRGGRGGEGWRHRWMNRDRPEGRPDRDRDDGPERL